MSRVLELAFLACGAISGIALLFLQIAETSASGRCAAETMTVESTKRATRMRRLKFISAISAFLFFLGSWQSNVQSAITRDDERATEILRANRGIFRFREIEISYVKTLGSKEAIASLLPVEFSVPLAKAKALRALRDKFAGWVIQESVDGAELFRGPKADGSGTESIRQLESFFAKADLHAKFRPDSRKPKRGAPLISDDCNARIQSLTLTFSESNDYISVSTIELRLVFLFKFSQIDASAPMSIVDGDWFTCQIRFFDRNENPQFERPEQINASPLMREIAWPMGAKNAELIGTMGEFIVEVEPDLTLTKRLAPIRIKLTPHGLE